ncbi:MAG: hypothetical protein HYZ47_01310 [Simkania negevensis]|nr:hypothetical protein [Simkania negevensis]
MVSLVMIDQHQEDLENLEKEIFSHPAWYGHLTGMGCEDLLRDCFSFSYLFRSGEERFHYYLSFVVEAPFIFKHQPFTIAMEESNLKWEYRNGFTRWAPTLEGLIPSIIHQPLELCLPIVKS